MEFGQLYRREFHHRTAMTEFGMFPACVAASSLRSDPAAAMVRCDSSAAS
jgi:hypothetical protein